MTMNSSRRRRARAIGARASTRATTTGTRAPSTGVRPPAASVRSATGHVTLGARKGASGGAIKPAPMKLGAKKLTAADIDLESMLN